ncbi:MAG: TonB-dependent receptor, partial [Rhizobiaceae bacterium]|nr:TonB-dependent receptor [Rhizobiaceae bacterium]
MSFGFNLYRSEKLRFKSLKNGALSRCGTGIYLTSLCLASPLAVAFDTDSTLDTLPEVTVTSTKIDVPAQYSTQSVTILTEEQIKESNFSDTTEILRQLGGLQFMKAGGPGQFNAPEARGLPSAYFLVVVDGVKVNEGLSSGIGNFLGQIDPKLIERIEILRGPQGQLFGRNAMAGAVQIVTKRPSGEMSGDVSATVGSYGTRALKGRLDLPSFGGINVQVSGFFREHGGYVKAPSNTNLQGIRIFNMRDESSFNFKTTNYDRNLSQLKTYGGRLGVSYDSGPFSLYYSYDQSYARDDQGLTVFKDSCQFGSIYNPTNLCNQPATQFVVAPSGVTSFPQQAQGNKYNDSIDYSIPWVPMITKAHGHMLNLGYEASDDLTLRSISGYRYVNRYGGNTLSQAVNAVLPSATEYLRSRTYSEELQAIYDTEQFDITVGGIYFREEIKDERASFFGVNCIGSPFIPACIDNGAISGPGHAPFGDSFKRSWSTTNSYGLYAQGTWTPDVLDNRLSLIAGIRYSKETKKGLRSFDVGICSTGAQALCTVPGTPGPVDIRNKYSTSRFDPAFTIKFDINPDVNIYARWARGFRSGGSSVRSPNFG